jgi:hypothetical protein
MVKISRRFFEMGGFLTLCPLYRREQGNIVGRDYINFVKNAANPSFLMPF